MLFYENDRSIDNNYVYNQFNENMDFGIHLHGTYEFVYVYEGMLEVTVEEKTFEVNKGEAVLILPNLIHSYKTPVSSKNFLCIFSASFVYNFYLKTKDKVPNNPVFKFEGLKEINDVLINNKNEYLLKSFFYKIIYLFDKDNSYSQISDKHVSVIRDILSYIEKNYDKNISLKDLSEELFYHYNYLSFIINSVFKSNFSSLVNMQRIDRAIYLIKNTCKTFSKISIEVGFPSIRSFNRNFKEITGKSPSEYRTDEKQLSVPT